MALQGKGYFIWRILNSEGGDINAIANLGQQSGMSHVLVKIADGTNSFNLDPGTGIDLVPPLVDALHARGIQVWGWHYVYGIDPVGEANIAIRRVQQLGLDGYVIDAESEYKQPGKAGAARTFMSRLRGSLPNFPIALSSYRYPSIHPQLPWREFLERCDLNMPQVYWLQARNPAEQLIKSVREFQVLVPFRPIVPTGAAFVEHGWQPTPAEVVDFMQTAQNLNLGGANFWEWSNTRRNLPDVWTAFQNYSWAAPLPTGPDITQQFIEALNTRDSGKVLALYHNTAVHVTASRTVQGLSAIRGWYDSLFSQILPGATFTMAGFSGTGSSRHLTWTAISSGRSVRNGNDTIGLVNGKIAYHYTFFTVS